MVSPARNTWLVLGLDTPINLGIGDQLEMLDAGPRPEAGSGRYGLLRPR